MRIAIRYGRADLELDLAGSLLGSFTGPQPLSDPAGAVSGALDHPYHYPPLRRALTPGDHLVVLVDETLPDVGSLLVPVLDHIASADVDSSSVTVLCPTSSTQDWIEALPERHEEIHVETHDPKDRRRLSYLATTAAGRRLYLNRGAIDADQLIVLSERRFDPRLGYAGAEGAIFPALADDEILKDVSSIFRTEVPGTQPWSLQTEAIEVSWLLGQPFHIQCIPSRNGGVARVVAGASDACRAAERLLDSEWKVQVPRRADVVLVSFSHDPDRRTFADLAAAVNCAARIVRPEGRIVLFAESAPQLGPGAELLRNADEPRQALASLEKANLAGTGPARLWAQAATHARISVLEGWPEDTTEELFATALDDVAQVKRLAAAGEIVVLEDAHRMMAIVE